MLLNLENLVKKYNLKIKGVIHIGAHYGEENSVYDNINISNRMFFEPLEKNFNKLLENVGEDFIKHKIALGNENKNVEMFVEEANMGQSSSILKPLLHLKQYPHIQFNNIEVVEMKRLDDMDINLKNFNFINIDVQGYELEVFKGSVETLKSIDYIMSEINRDEVYENCAKIEELKEFLKPYGFNLVEQNWAGHTWGDGLFIKIKK
jgi:FkbM family methyltransferase